MLAVVGRGENATSKWSDCGCRIRHSVTPEMQGEEHSIYMDHGSLADGLWYSRLIGTMCDSQLCKCGTKYGTFD